MNSATTNDEDNGSGGSVRERFLAENPWFAFLAPLIAFMIGGTFEATPQSGAVFFGLIRYEYYPLVYTIKILLVTATVVWVWPAYRSLLPIRVNWLAVLVGVIGVVFWVGIVELRLEQYLPLGWLTGTGERSAYNPMEQLSDRPLLAYAFFAVRFFGLAVAISIAEEMFLRGFVMRYVENPDRWPELGFTKLGWPALIAGTALPMLMHPAELFASLVWFSMVTWLMLRTGSIWNSILAHMVTNLLLGIYVVQTGKWYFM
ncbi:MAG: CAAX prenyl protease-related protein [Pirellulales bacterium]|nr:CAAX prenyl protease-related protein [Pirellulales bacterium]